MHFSMVLVLGSFLIFPACDKVSEKPEPDQFMKNELVDVSAVSDTNGEALVDILVVNNLKEALSVSFGKPNHGELTPDATTSKFKYKAHKGYSGVDSFSYEICRTSLCKSGHIRIEVKQKPLPCVSSFSWLESYRDTIYADTNMTVGLHPGDFFCKEATIRKDANSWYTKTWSIDSTGINFQLPNQKFTKDTEVRFYYYVCKDNTVNQCVHRICSTLVKVNDSYCRSIFSVKSFSYPKPGSKKHPYLFTLNEAKKYVFSCVNDLDEASFKVFARDDWAIIEPGAQAGEYLISAPTVDAVYARFYYEFRSNSGEVKKGLGRIQFGE